MRCPGWIATICLAALAAWVEPASALPEAAMLTPQEVAAFSHAALNGDVEASERMAFAAQFTGTFDEAEYWTLIAAENGSILGMRDVGGTLLLQESPRNCLRALYWIKQYRRVQFKLEKEFRGNSETDVERARSCKYAKVSARPLNQIERRALAGGRMAASSLASHYQAANAIDEAVYWLQIAVQNGAHYKAQELADWLPKTGTAQDCRRAIYWLKRLRKAKSRTSERRAVSDQIRNLQARCPPIPVQSLDP
jgi:hypothetical protein